MKLEEITVGELITKEFIEEKVKQISQAVDEGSAINALSGGVDSSVVTMLGHKALGARLKTYFINNGIMRQESRKRSSRHFRSWGSRSR